MFSFRACVNKDEMNDTTVDGVSDERPTESDKQNAHTCA